MENNREYHIGRTDFDAFVHAVGSEIEQAQDVYKRQGETYNGKLTASQLSQVRMLTEVECERLKGFPDNYNRYGIYDGERKEIAKIHRYALIGNAVSVQMCIRDSTGSAGVCDFRR